MTELLMQKWATHPGGGKKLAIVMVGTVFEHMRLPRPSTAPSP